MAQEQKLNWCFTCEFSVFAQAYTGLDNSSEIIKFIAENDQISFTNSAEFIKKESLKKIWENAVEIRPSAIMENNGNTVLSLIVCFNNIGTTIELECDCVEPDELLKNIINIIYKAN